MDGVQLCVAPCYLFVPQKRSEGKAEGGTCYHGSVRVGAVGEEGSDRGCTATAMVVESTHAPLPGIGQSELAREREVRSGQVMLMPYYVGYI